MKEIINQKGFANYFAVLLLFGSVVLGIFLVQQRTNLLPKAAGKTVACDGQSLSGQSDQSQKDFADKYGADAAESWVNEHEQELKAKGTPCPEEKQSSGENKSKSDSKKTPENNKCKLERQDPSMTADCAKCINRKKPSLIKDITKNDKNFDNCTDKQTLNYWCNGGTKDSKAKSECETVKKSCGEVCSKNETPSSTSKDNSSSQKDSSKSSTPQVCTEGEKTYYDSKVATRLAVYYAILKGMPNTCVKADLGVPDLSQLTAKNEAGKEGRLYLCSGSDSKKDNLVLKWRVDTGENNKLESVKDELSKDLNNLPNKSHVQKAEQILKTSFTPNVGSNNSSTKSTSNDTSCNDAELQFNGCLNNETCGLESWKCSKDGKSVKIQGPENGDCKKSCTSTSNPQPAQSCKEEEKVFAGCDETKCGFEFWKCPNSADKGASVQGPTDGDCNKPDKNPRCISATL